MSLISNICGNDYWIDVLVVLECQLTLTLVGNVMMLFVIVITGFAIKVLLHVL
jgi:hypothetical protein